MIGVEVMETGIEEEKQLNAGEMEIATNRGFGNDSVEEEVVDQQGLEGLEEQELELEAEPFLLEQLEYRAFEPWPFLAT